MIASRIHETLNHLSSIAASSVVSRARVASPALNAVLLRRLSAGPGEVDAVMADPVFEIARAWKLANRNLGELSDGLLHPDLVTAMDNAKTERMPRDRYPYSHQIQAWEAARAGFSCLVSSGTGSGKTECFMVPVLDDLLRDSAKGRLSGVRAIVIYPLNALIESQRERLAAWTEALNGRISFALYNGLTPETPRKVEKGRLSAAEIGDRQTIRDNPPSILVTNVTMLEYLLLRAQDRSLLERSQGLLRWIILDEAHSYIGAQAAEMALLLRRVRAAFGVAPDQMRLMATSATISEGADTEVKLKRFVADLAGLSEERVEVIEGHPIEPELPDPTADIPIDIAAIGGETPDVLWNRLASHPRLQKIKRAMTDRGIRLSLAAEILFGMEGKGRRVETQFILDAAARAQCPATQARFMPWRVHLFHRAQGGIWVCIDPGCDRRDEELVVENSGWGFGSVWMTQRDQCVCGAPVFELFVCNECGAPHLRAGLVAGASARLIPLREVEVDDFAVDSEPDPETEEYGSSARGKVILAPARGDTTDRFIRLDDGTVFDNVPPESESSARIILIEEESSRDCCPGAEDARLAPLRFGPPFFMGNAVPALVESLAPPLDQPGLPMGGRRAITFSDSRQGTARLAAKLQQDAERCMARAFLYHAVQEERGLNGEERIKLERKLNMFRQEDPDAFADEITIIEHQLTGKAKPVMWNDLVDRFAQQEQLREFATEVWRDRVRGGREMAEEPRKLAEMFLYRELFRRPKVQNNAETMGLLRLSFPKLEEKAQGSLPRVLTKAGIDKDGWMGLVLTAVDFVFRDVFATDVKPDWMVRFVSPRGGWLKSVCRPGLAPHDRPIGSRPWPGPVPQSKRPSRLHRLVYTLIGGRWDNPVDQDRAGEVLSAIWSLITSTVAKDVGGGAFRLDFQKAAVVRLDHGWLCPVTRRIFGYSPSGRSPYNPDQVLKPCTLPRLPHANAGGLDPEVRKEVMQWCLSNVEVAVLRRSGLWTDLHDRIAAYAPFLRAQEHSAQIERPVLATYEERFKEGKINLLNCSTTMEMGVDIPHVRLVINANVPPSISNYRQRVGRAGRRGEPWAFGMTFCRDLPLDRIVFGNPSRFLSALIPAPAVRLDSHGLVMRHVHAALLAAFLRDQPEGFNLKASTGSFFGATEEADKPVAADAPADSFLDALQGDWAMSAALAHDLALLIRGTVLDGRKATHLSAETAEVFEAILGRWRVEYAELLARGAAASEADVKKAFENKARRMKGAFLLNELARCGFTPSYGFPVDVVSFDHLSGHDRDMSDTVIAFGDRRGGASRPLNVAIREYAPGGEVVVDGLVHRSEGVMPAWNSMADVSRLEDLQYFWECRACQAFGLFRIRPDACPHCSVLGPDWKYSLRPTGFLGRIPPHTGYENLGHVPYEMPRLSAVGASWQSLPDPEAGRMRADPGGQVITLGSGPQGKGYALCLLCGRAEAETKETHGSLPPELIKRHKPLAEARGVKLVQGRCPGGYTEPQRIKRSICLIHTARTDVFELQLPRRATRAAGLAIASALREALAERLGTEAREIGLAVGSSVGPGNDPRVSAFLYDRASGGAGLVSRLAEAEWFNVCLTRATEWLDCPEDCDHGCPACILRPDLNFGDEELDRKKGLVIAKSLCDRLVLPESLQLFGLETKQLELPLTEWLDRKRRGSGLSSVTLYMHGNPAEWELADWPVAGLFARMKETGVVVKLVLASGAITDKAMELAQKLDLHRLTTHALLAHSQTLPMVRGVPVLAVVSLANGQIAIVAPAEVEAVPGPCWGRGTDAALVYGPPVPDLPVTRAVLSDQLVALSGGNARLIRAGKQLDGPSTAFGRRFWALLATESPLTMAAIRAHGVRAATYTDRYLFTPFNLRLLVEVISTIPGEKSETALRVAIARLERSEQQGWAIFHPFAEDAMRRAVLEALLPGIQVDIRSKASLPHARTLELSLNDGREVKILLDQGFGAWRAEGIPRHDFRAEPAQQARTLKSLVFEVCVEAGHDAPIVLEDG